MIKFRAWGKNGNYPGTPSEKFEMFYDVSVVTTYKDKEQHVIADFGMYNESEYNGTEIIDYTLMQSTGLFDKNGKEIFEGDVVRIGTLEGTPIGAIEFDKSNACFKVPNNKKYVFGGEYVTDFHAKYFEIIGNIYQNSDLLESVEK